MYHRGDPDGMNQKDASQFGSFLEERRSLMARKIKNVLPETVERRDGWRLTENGPRFR